MTEPEPHILRVPEFFRVFLYKFDDLRRAGLPREHQSPFLLLVEEIRRGGANGYVNMSATWRFSKHRLTGIGSFLMWMSSGTPRNDEDQQIADTARDLAHRVYAYAEVSAIDQLADLEHNREVEPE